MSLSIDQQKAIALAKARKRKAESVNQEPMQEKSFFRSVGNFFTGNDRATEKTDRLPELSEDNGLLFGESGAKIAAIAPAIMTATDPNEIAKIITKNFENVGVTYDKDAQGNIYPILANNKTGAVAQVNRPGLSGFDVLQGLGLMAAYTPAGKATTVAGAVARNAATEGLIQGAQELSGGDFDGDEVALAAGLGGGIQALGNAAGVGKRLLTKTDELTPEQQLVKSAQANDIPLMTSDALPPQTFVGKTGQQLTEKIPVLGTGAKREAQQIKRVEAIDRLAEKYGEFSYDAIVGSLKAQKDRIKNAAGSVLEKTGNQLDEVGAVPLAKTRAVLADVSEEMSKKGVIKNNNFMADVDELIKAIDEAPQSFTMVKENRTLFREIANGADKAERSQLSSRAKSMLKRIEYALGQDMKDFAKTNLDDAGFSKWERANRVWADEAKKLTKTKLKNVLDKGDVTPEAVQRMLFSQNRSELDLLYSSLTPKGRSNARSAIISKMFEDMSKRQSGVTPNALTGEMKKHSAQIQAFFRGDERKALNGLRKALDATKRAQDAAVSTPTGQQLIGAAAGGAVIVEPTIAAGAGTLGLVGRLYDSPAVRDALIKLHSLPPGSTRFEQALGDVLGLVNSASQSARSAASAPEQKRDIQVSQR